MAPKHVQRGRTLAALLLAFVSGTAQPMKAASGTIIGHAADGQANSDGTVSAGTALYGRVGADAGVRHSVVHIFQIPPSIVSDPTQQFSSATYTTRLGSGSAMSLNVDLYGLGYDTTPTLLGSDFYEGSLDSNNPLIQNDFITPSIPANAVVSSSNGALVNYLNGVLATARADGTSTAYAFLRNSLDGYTWSGIYVLGMNEATTAYQPTLSYNTINTNTGWRSVPLGGGGYATGIVSTPTGSDIYMRTDVGGVFRWVPAGDPQGNGSWLPLTDKIVPFATLGGGALLGVESIAVDPNNTSRLYIAAGNQDYPSGLRGIYGSDDRGSTWYLVGSSNTFPIRGNGQSRAHGERLAVDPNNSNVLWYGSTTSGLRKFVKSGSTWTATQISSAAVPYGTVNVGVSFVVCDPNSGNTIVYAGVADPTVGGVYKSLDGGASWSKVSGAALLAPRRAQVGANGTLYITGGTGGVAKLPRGGALALLGGLPASLGTVPVVYHGVAVDPNSPSANVVYVAQASGGSDIILRSSDGGTTWAVQSTTFNEGAPTSYNHARTEPDGTPSLTGYWFGNIAALLVNPANSNELWLGDFDGVTRTRNASALGTSPGSWWSTLQKGHEETVVFSLKVPPSGPKLMTGLADVGGFRYADTNSRPTGAGGSEFSNPAAGNNTSLDFSEANPSVWARAWVNPSHGGGNGAVSRDGGVSWAYFGQIDSKPVVNSVSAGWEQFDVGPYLRRQQAAGVSTVTLVLRASDWREPSPLLRFSSKEGTNPPQLLLNGTTTIAPTDDAWVYANSTGTNYGGSATLLAQDYYGNASYVRWTYLKFNLAAQPPITTAVLKLYRLAATNTASFITTIHSTPTASWTESALTWSNRPTNLYAAPANLWKGGGRVAVSATDPSNIVWMAIKNGGAATPAYYTKDRGVTWAASSGGPDSQITGVYTNGSSIAPSGQPLTADRGNGNFYMGKFGSTAHIIYRSGDNGATWTQVSTVPNGGSHNMRTPQLVAAPVSSSCPTGGDVWLCDDGTYSGAGGGLWRSTNSATSWSSITGIGKVTAVSFGKAASGSGYTVFIYGYKGGVKGVYRSDDYGSTWARLPDPTIADVLSLAGDRQTYGKVYLGTNGRGVFQSQ